MIKSKNTTYLKFVERYSQSTQTLRRPWAYVLHTRIGILFAISRKDKLLSDIMQHQEFEPPEELQNIIKCFWYTSRDFGELQSNFEILPDSYAEIVFHFGSACSISYNGVLQPLPSPFLMGLLDHPVFLNTQSRLEVIGIRCFPWTVFNLLGLSPAKDSVHIFKHPISDLQSTLEKLIHADGIDKAIVELQQYLLNAQRIAVDTVLFKAGAAMREANGTMRVSDVATAANVTVRTLERRFKQSSGYTVKDVSGLIRFEQIRNRLWLYPGSNIAALAQELGYTDQSHLCKEFKRYSGTTPTAFCKKRKQ